MVISKLENTELQVLHELHGYLNFEKMQGYTNYIYYMNYMSLWVIIIVESAILHKLHEYMVV